MYNKLDYIKRGLRHVNNRVRPSHKKLSTLMFYTTDICDSKCKHCLIWAKRPIIHMSFDKIVEVMKSKCVGKDTLVGLEGGEFLLHPEADKILSWFHINHPYFDLLSNCLKPQNTIDAVKKYTPHRLYISLDGNKESYEYMRGKDGYNSVIKVIEECKDIVPISLMFTLSPYNSFSDMDHVIEVAKKNNVDIRIGIYNNIDFFNTIEKAHETNISSVKEKENITISSLKTVEKAGPQVAMSAPKVKNIEYNENFTDFQNSIPASVKDTAENFDFLALYDEWRQQNTKLKCYSILDSVVIHTNGDVPICQSLEKKQGNIYNNSLDEIINSKATQKLQNHYVHNCNGCWVNFHRKYDIVMLRTLEGIFSKKIVELIYGKYQWSFDKDLTYKQYMQKFD